MPSLRAKLCFLIAVSLIVISARGQSLRVYRFTEEQGLPSPLVKSIARDNEGMVWAATDDGLVRFDGNDYHLFRNELPTPYVKSLLPIAGGDLMISTDMGVLRYSNKSGKDVFTVIEKGSTHLTDSALCFPKLFFRTVDSTIWLSDNYRIYRYNGKRFRAFEMGPDVVSNSYNRSFSFAEDGNGHLFAFSENGLPFRFNILLQKFEPVTALKRFPGVHAAFQLSPGQLLVGSRAGLFAILLDKMGNVLSSQLLSGIEISCIQRDHGGTIYAGTWEKGLYTLTKQADGQFALAPVPEYIDRDVNQIYIDSEDNIWISADAGIILIRHTTFGAPFQQLTSSSIRDVSAGDDGFMYFSDGIAVYAAPVSGNQPAVKLFNSAYPALQVLSLRGELWISDENGGISRCSPNGTIKQRFDFSSKGRAVFQLTADNDGNIWACQDISDQIICISPDYNVSFYGRKQGLLSRVISFAIASDGRLYAGGMSDTAYLAVYDRASNRFRNLSQSLKFQRNTDININDMVAGREPGVLWLGSSFGLIRYSHGTFSRVNLNQYTENSIKAICIDSLGYLWFANNKGLHRYLNGDLQSFNEHSGMQTRNIAYRTLVVDRRNRLWVGTISGVELSVPLQNPRKTLKPLVRGLLLNNNIVSTEVLYKLIFDTKTFATLKVASPEFPANQLIYEKWLEGVDTNWTLLPDPGNVVLGGLSPGKYNLRIRARETGNLGYSDPLEIPFEIKLVWYERWWVLLLLFIAVVLLFYLAISQYSRKLRYDNEKLERIISERMQEITLQHNQIEQQNARINRKNADLSAKNKELEIAKNNAEEAAKAKTQFLSVMSHEIRTPMNAVIGITHLLIRDNPRPEQLEDLKILKFSAENLLGIINDVLDLNKIEAGKLNIEKVEFNLRNLAEGVRSSMMHKAREKGIEFGFEYDEKLPLFMLSDPLRIAQILNNLVSNAIKFTEKGGVLIEIKQAAVNETIHDVEFRISDSGIGIPPEKQQFVFEAFAQASSETTRKYGGTGLGLAITGKLLEMLGSQINLRSEVGEGTTFSFTLRMEAGTTRQLGNATEDDADNFRFNGQRILLVEDNKINELIARKFMDTWNLQVDSAINGLEAIEKLNQENYHLILMDLQMPEMDGYKTASIIRSRGMEPYISIPIIALTASSRAEVQERISIAGLNDYVSKPFKPAELLIILKKYLLL